MIISSGNVVHNLRLIERSRPDIGFDWTLRFDDTVGRQLTEARDGILAAVERADFHFDVPTPDHFILLLYTTGLAVATGMPSFSFAGYAMGSLSMTCYGVGMKEVVCEEANGAAQLPEEVPPEQTNIYTHLALANTRR